MFTIISLKLPFVIVFAAQNLPPRSEAGKHSPGHRGKCEGKKKSSRASIALLRHFLIHLSYMSHLFVSRQCEPPYRHVAATYHASRRAGVNASLVAVVFYIPLQVNLFPAPSMPELWAK